MKNDDVIMVGFGGLLVILISLFTPIGALFLAAIGIIAFIIYKLSRPQSE